jgi:hypothetical protein
MYELFKAARSSDNFPPEEELREAITTWLDTNSDDLMTFMATAFYAGMIFQSEDDTNPISVTITAEEAFDLTRQLTLLGETTFTIHVEGNQ